MRKTVAVFAVCAGLALMPMSAMAKGKGHDAAKDQEVVTVVAGVGIGALVGGPVGAVVGGLIGLMVVHH